MFTINDKQCDFRKISARTGLRIMALAPAMVNDNNLDSAVKATEAVTEIAVAQLVVDGKNLKDFDELEFIFGDDNPFIASNILSEFMKTITPFLSSLGR